MIKKEEFLQYMKETFPFMMESPSNYDLMDNLIDYANGNDTSGSKESCIWFLVAIIPEIREEEIRRFYIEKNEKIYTWKDIIKVNRTITAEEFPISGVMDSSDIYQIDDFINSVASKYGVDKDEIQTYMMDKIDFDGTLLPFGAVSCGCYINGLPEWRV